MKKSTIIKGRLIGLLTFCSTLGFSQTATTTVDTTSTLMPNPKLLLGITYDCRSSLSDNSGNNLGFHNTDGTFNPLVDAVFNNFPMTTLRYPANGIMQGFEWKKSIGPIGSRTPQQIFSQPYPAQVLEFGFDEFMAMTAARGVLPKDVQIMLPIYDTAITYSQPTQNKAAIPYPAQNAADWVEYANCPDTANWGGGIAWGAIRAANGHPAPYGIELWNLGNEPYTPNEYGSMGVNNYINTILPIIDSMLVIDPSVKITLTVMSNPSSSWTDTILNSTQLQGKIYGINSHYFLTEDYQSGLPPANQPTIYNALSKLVPLAAAAQSKGYKLIVGDQAHAVNAVGPVPTQAEQDIAMQWQGANETADFLLAMSQIPNIERSNFWVYGLWSNVWHPIRKNNDGTFTSMPVAELYKIFNPVFLDKSVSVSTTSPASSDGIPYSIRSSAFVSSNSSQLNIISVNRDKINIIPLQINGISGYNLTNVRLLTATALNSDTIIETSITADVNGNFPMPPMSILILEYSNVALGLTNLTGNGNEYLVYPNPFNTQTTLHIDNLLNNATLTVLNCFGQTVKQVKNISGQTITLHRDNLSGGLYFIQLTQDNKVIITNKLIIAD
jgi:alpha-L-arabinofuranosidase